MKKKIVAMCATCAIAALAVGGTLAYFTDTASNKNTMTLGGVAIEQWEYQRAVGDDGAYETDTIDGQASYVLEGFEQDKPLLPIVGDPSTGEAGWDSTTVRMTQVGSYGGMSVFAGKNAQDKFVVVKNTGDSAAYVRTLVAIEVGSTQESLIGTSHHSAWAKNTLGEVEINGVMYTVSEYIYQGFKFADGTWRHENGALTAGESAYPSLSQVYLKSVADNDDAKNLDGNENGKLDILVLSQAVQADGFDKAETALDTAFGDVTVEKAAEWFEAI